MIQSSASNAIRSENSGAESVSFIIDRDAFLRAMSHVQAVVERQNTIQILSNVKIETLDGFIKLTATDLDLALTETVVAETLEQGSIAVPAHTLYDVLRKLPSGSNVEFSVDNLSNGKARVEANNSKFSLACLSTENYPSIEAEEFPVSFKLSASELVTLIDKTKFAISNEEVRYYLNGIYFHVVEKEGAKFLSAVATDGHKLAQMFVDLPEGAESMKGVIMPRKIVLELSKIIDNATEEVTVSVSETKICFIAGSTVIISKLIDGVYPDYNRVIPANNDKLLEVDSSLFKSSVDRVSIVTSEKSREILFAAASGKVTLNASSEENGTANEEFEVLYENDNVQIRFNSRALMEVLSRIEGNTLKMSFADSVTAVLIYDSVDPNITYLVMPLRT